MPDAIRQCTFAARLDCHYLLRQPDIVDSRTILVVALHGFGQNPETMLQQTAGLFGSAPVIASMQGPNQFFLDRETFKVGYCWNTNRHTGSSIRLHHEMVRHVLSEAGREYGIPAERRILLGFSQPVSLNYRFAATCPEAVRGVVGVCGGLPGDWETGRYSPVRASVLHIARRQDEFYPAAITEQYPEKLRLRIVDLEFHLLEGSHRIPSQGHTVVEGWLKRILG